MTHSLRNWFVRRPQPSIKNARKKRTRLGLEHLEDRTAPAIFAVSLAGNDANTGGIADPFRTIQRAITAAAAADDGVDDIRVQLGIYNIPGVDLAFAIPASDNIDNLNITGGWDLTFTANAFPPGSIYVPQSPSNINAADVDIFDADVTLQFFTFVFDGVLGPGGTRQSAGILVRAPGVDLSTNTIEVPSSSAAGANDAYGVQTLFGGDVSGLFVGNNTITASAQFASGGIYLNPGTNTGAVLVTGNTVNGDNLSQGIVADSLSNVVIDFNNLSRTGPADAGFQQLIFAGPFNGSANQTNVTITFNTLNNNDLANSVGIEVGNTSGNGLTITGVTLTDNTVQNSTLGLLITPGADGLTVGDGTPASGGSYTSNAIGIFATGVANLSINNAEASNNTSNGVLAGDLTGTLTILASTFNGNGSGITLDNIPTVTLSDLTITGNTSGGQISNVMNLNFTGTTGGVADVITASGTSLQHTRDPLGANVVNQALALTNISNLSLAGQGGEDTFNITPGSTTTINVDGDLPAPPASPGDTLDVDTAGTTNPLLTFTSTPAGFQGSYTFADRQPVNFQEIETLADTVDLTITKSDAPDPVIAGTPLTYTIVVSNPGTLGVADATVTDLFPANLTNVTFTSVASGGATGNTPAGAGNINDTVDLPVGSSITYTVSGTVSPSATGTLSNTATVTPPAGVVDSVPANNSDTEVTTINALNNLVVTKTDSPDPVRVANNITYTITLTNAGPSNALAVSLTDVVPARTTFVSFTAPAGFTSLTPPAGGTGTVTSTTPVLAAGAVATFTLVVRVNAQSPANPPIVNTVTVVSATPESSTADNTATATTQIARVAYFAVGAAPGGPPVVTVFGPSGAVVASFLVFNPRFSGGVRVAVGDVNGDGVSDIIVAQGPGTRRLVKIVDGTKLAGLSPSSVVPDSALLAAFFAYQRGFQGGVFVAAGDVNGDGRDDIITAPGSGANRPVKVVDAARLHLVEPDGRISFAALHGSFFAYRPQFAGGVTVAVGDVNGDDRADVIVGPASGARPIKVVDSARLNLIDADGRISNAALLGAFFAYAPSFAGGVSVAAGFVNGDNRADIVTGRLAGVSLVKVIDGTKLNQVDADGRIQQSALLASNVVFESSFRGSTYVAAMDLDNDGLAEILAGFGPSRRRVLGLDMLQNITQLAVDADFDAGSLGGNA
jgi:uncharacterized repeat protein (TIGR01451 family)